MKCLSLNIQAARAASPKTDRASKKEEDMVTLEMNDEEAKVMLNVLERYHSHLEVEVRRTDKREFREALKERESKLIALIEKVRSIAK
jgi:hypothetical protein